MFQVLAKEENPGIKYEYLLPIIAADDSSSSYESSESEPSDAKHTLKSGTSPSIPAPPAKPTATTNATVPHRRKRRFLWKIVAFTACSKSCGGGIQAPVIRCVRESPLRVFVPKKCAHLAKPVLNENLMRCNTQPCPGYWKLSDWSTTCNCSDPYEDEYQTREVKCVQELGTGMVIQVQHAACSDDHPPVTRQCECAATALKPSADSYMYRTQQQKRVNSIKQRLYGMTNIAATPVHSKRGEAHHAHKKSGVWLAGAWNEQCSSECGDGVEYRAIFCDRSAPNVERCELRHTPDLTRQCTSDVKCGVGEWFVGPWTKCLGHCFNLTQTRQVLCSINGEIVADSACAKGERPIDMQKCGVDDVAYCAPKWLYSEWSEV